LTDNIDTVPENIKRREERGDVLDSRLEELKKEYAKTKHNKATNKHLGILRRKIAEVKKDIIEAGKRQRGSGFFVKKTGDATVALLGFPSSGKSSIINRLANTNSKTASYAFTTTSIIPGTMLYRGAHVQIFDMPGIIEDAHKGLGGGRSVISALRVTDLVLFVIEADQTKQLDMLMRELNALDIRVNRPKPRIRITEVGKNIGIKIELNRSGLPNSDVEEILSEFRIHNVVVKIEDRIEADELISIVAGKATYMKGLVALNKIDKMAKFEEGAKEIRQKWGMEVVPISAKLGTNIDELRSKIYDHLNLMTIYLAPEGDRESSMILENGATVADAAKRVHTKLIDIMRSAYITGPSAKFERQKVGAGHVLKGGDRVTFIRGE
jgi:ribosome-interacting GTPase 1